jgi:cell division protein FtsW (lipid II flippase)
MLKSRSCLLWARFAVFILIALANLSTALMLFGVSILLLIIGRISIKQIAIVCGAGFILLLGVIFLGPRRHTYTSRVSTFLHPDSTKTDKSFQSDHAKIAIASGGFLAKAPATAPKGITCPNHTRMRFTPLLLKNTAWLAVSRWLAFTCFYCTGV